MVPIETTGLDGGSRTRSASAIASSTPGAGFASSAPTATIASASTAACAAAVARHYGARRDGGLLDGWLVDTSDAAAVDEVAAAGIACRAVPLLMSSVEATAEMARAALALAAEVAA